MGRSSGSAVPMETARVAWAANPKGTPAMAMRDRLQDLFVDDDFVDWFPVDGQRGVSPTAPALFRSARSDDGLSDAVDGECVGTVVQVAASVGNVRVAGEAEGSDGQVAEGCQSPWCGAGAQLAVVFVERHIACPM